MADPDFFRAYSRSQRPVASTPTNGASVTPQRRPRVVEDVDSSQDDDDISINENGSIRSHSSKRQRLSSDVEDNTDLSGSPERDATTPQRARDVPSPSPQGTDSEESDHDEPADDSDTPSDAPVLPDSFRRSPRQSHNRTSNGGPRNKHLAGSIVRIALTDFVTYTKAEFYPGPNLNMIIGPNGTGKSTLVCAICLGLGSKPDLLGRAKDVGEYVKHGQKVAQIEIELAAKQGRDAHNPIITTKITKEGNKTEFFIDGKKVTKRILSELMSSFSIQIDNLCQFLPQDRVVEFAAQTPVALLASTQKAVAEEYMSQWHEELKSLRQSQKEKQASQQTLMERLKAKEDRQRAQQADIVQIRERDQLKQQYDAMQRYKAYNEYSDLRTSFNEAKAREKAAAARLRELREQASPSVEAIGEKLRYAEAIEAHINGLQSQLPASQKRVKDMLTAHETATQEMAEKSAQIKAEGPRNQKLRDDLRKTMTELKQIEQSLAHPPEQVDFAEMNSQLQDLSRSERDLSAKKADNDNEQSSVALQLQQRRAMIESLTADQERSQTQVGQQENKVRDLSLDTFKAWEWIQKNRDKFGGDIYGPVAVECSVKDQSHAAAVESTLSRADQLAITVTSRADFDKLDHHLYKAMGLTDVRLRQSTHPLSSFRPNYTREEIRDFGLEAFILDLMEGPEPVLAMLCDNRNIHQTGFTTGDITDAQYNRLTNSRMGSWLTAKESCQVTRRPEYGPDATSVRSNPLKPAKTFTHNPPNNQDDGETAREKNRINDEMRELEDNKKQLQAARRDLDTEHAQVLDKYDKLKDKKNQLQHTQATFAGLGAKKEGLEVKRDGFKDSLLQAGQIRNDLHDEIDRLALTKAANVCKLPNAVEAARRAHQSLFEARIMLIEAKSEHEQLQARHAEEVQAIKDHETAVDDHKKSVASLRNRGQELQAEIQALPTAQNEMEQTVIQEISAMSPADFATEVESVEARLDLNRGSANRSILEQYQRREKQIEEERAQLGQIESDLENLDSQITDIRSQWEPELDRLVEQISEAFAENFARIHCVGEVVIHKDEDFDQWAIHIKVKFRENEQLAKLDNHRQSGGERAVSTIFYLMSLQALARAPFRVVDEINQGMDPRNERMVHSRMVDIACGENSASQYFLLTPKLLSGLRYHPSMKVHCIASGEHMPQEHGRLDFNLLAKKALEVKGLA